MSIKKRRIWCWFQIRWKICKKIPTKKVISIKVKELCTFSPFSTVYKSSQPCNFLRGNFFATFSTDSNSASNSAFDTHIKIIWKNYFLVILPLFANLGVKCARNGSTNLKTYFMCLRIQFCIYQWVRTLNFQKKSKLL